LTKADECQLFARHGLGETRNHRPPGHRRWVE
jgi:hypothetical protein